MRKIIFDKGDYLKQKRKEELKKKGEEIRKKCKRRKYTNILYFETKEDVFKHITSYFKVDYEIPQEVIKHIINEAMYCGIHVSKGEIWECIKRIQKEWNIQRIPNKLSRHVREIEKRNKAINDHYKKRSNHNYTVNMNDLYGNITEEQMNEIAEEVMINILNSNPPRSNE